MASKTEAPKVTNSVKACRPCGRTLCVSMFAKNAARSDGLQTQCRACHQKSTARWLSKHPEKNAEYCARWATSNPEKARANEAKKSARRAVRRNRLVAAARHFAGRPRWEQVVYGILVADPLRASFTYASQTLSDLDYKFTEGGA